MIGAGVAALAAAALIAMGGERIAHGHEMFGAAEVLVGVAVAYAAAREARMHRARHRAGHE